MRIPAPRQNTAKGSCHEMLNNKALRERQPRSVPQDTFDVYQRAHHEPSADVMITGINNPPREGHTMGIRTEQLNNKYTENFNRQAVFTPPTVNLANGINLLQQVAHVKSGDASTS